MPTQYMHVKRCDSSVEVAGTLVCTSSMPPVSSAPKPALSTKV